MYNLINKDKSDQKKSTRTSVPLKLWDRNLYEDSRIITWFYRILQKIQKTNLSVFRKIYL